MTQLSRHPQLGRMVWYPQNNDPITEDIALERIAAPIARQSWIKENKGFNRRIHPLYCNLFLCIYVIYVYEKGSILTCRRLLRDYCRGLDSPTSSLWIVQSMYVKQKCPNIKLSFRAGPPTCLACLGREAYAWLGPTLDRSPWVGTSSRYECAIV